MGRLAAHEVEYRVAPVYDAEGVVGRVSAPLKLPIADAKEDGSRISCYAPDRQALPFPHDVDAFLVSLSHRVSTDKVVGGWTFRVLRGEYPHPRTGALLPGSDVSVRAWDRIYLTPLPTAASPSELPAEPPLPSSPGGGSALPEPAPVDQSPGAGGQAHGAVSGQQQITLATPGGFSVRRVGTSQTTYRLSWSAVSGAAGYQVAYKATGNHPWIYLEVTGKTSVDLNFLPNLAHRAGVRAYSGSVTLHVPERASPWSRYLPFTTGTATPPPARSLSAPTSLNASASVSTTPRPGVQDARVTWSWAGVSGAAYYVLAYRRTGRRAAWTYVRNLTGTSYTLNNADSRQQYEAQIQALKAGGVGGSPWASFSSVTTPRDPDPEDNTPTIPTGLAVVQDTSRRGRVNLSWNAVAGATRYVVSFSQQELGARFGAWMQAPNDPTTPGYTYDGQVGVTYAFTVKACNANGCSLNAQNVQVTPGETKPGRPTGLTVRVDPDAEKTLIFSWNAVAGANGYYVSHRHVSDDDWLYQDVGNTTLFRKTNCVPGETYSFNVRAYPVRQGQDYSDWAVSGSFDFLFPLEDESVTGPGSLDTSNLIYTVANVDTQRYATLGDGNNPVEVGGTRFTVTEWLKLARNLGIDNTNGEFVNGSVFYAAPANKNARGKIFPKNGYSISWPWADDGAHADANRWVVYKRENDTFGFIGYTDETEGEGSQRRAVFRDEGIPPDLSRGPPIRRTEGAAFELNEETDEPEGWPGVSGRYAQRFVLGGYTGNPAELKFSTPGERMDFLTSLPSRETDSFVRELASRTGTEVRHVVESSGLLVFTSSGEWAVGSASGAFTPTSASANAVGYIGSSQVAPVVVDNRVLFVNRNGTRIYAVVQEQELGRLETEELTTLVHHIFAGDAIRAMVWSSDERMLFVALGNPANPLVSVTYLHEAGVIAFATHSPKQGFDLDIEDLAIVRETSGGAGAILAQNRDVLFITTRDGHLYKMPLRMLVDQQHRRERLQKDKAGAAAAELDVEALVETFSFGPQTRLGRDERAATDPIEHAAASGPEWLTARCRPFAESFVANVFPTFELSSDRLAFERARLGNPESGEARSKKNILFGAERPEGDPVVFAEYSGDQPDAVLYGAGIETYRDDHLQGGLPAYHVGGSLAWVSRDRRAIFMRDEGSGLLQNVIEDSEEVVTRDGRFIVDWAWAEESNMLLLAMSDGWLVSLTLTPSGWACAEHLMEGHKVVNVVAFSSRSTPDDRPAGLRPFTDPKGEKLALIAERTSDGALIHANMTLQPRATVRSWDIATAEPRTDKYTSDGTEVKFPAIVETFPLVPMESYEDVYTEIEPDKVILDAYSTQQTLTSEELEGRMVPVGFGPAAADDRWTTTPFYFEGPWFPQTTDGREVRRARVVAQSPFHEETDYAVEIKHKGAELLDVQGIALKFHTGDNTDATPGEA